MGQTAKKRLHDTWLPGGPALKKSYKILIFYICWCLCFFFLEIMTTYDVIYQVLYEFDDINDYMDAMVEDAIRRSVQSLE